MVWSVKILEDLPPSCFVFKPFQAVCSESEGSLCAEMDTKEERSTSSTSKRRAKWKRSGGREGGREKWEDSRTKLVLFKPVMTSHWLVLLNTLPGKYSDGCKGLLGWAWTHTTHSFIVFLGQGLLGQSWWRDLIRMSLRQTLPSSFHSYFLYQPNSLEGRCFSKEVLGAEQRAIAGCTKLGKQGKRGILKFGSITPRCL